MIYILSIGMYPTPYPGSLSPTSVENVAIFVSPAPISARGFRLRIKCRTRRYWHQVPPSPIPARGLRRWMKCRPRRNRHQVSPSPITSRGHRRWLKCRPRQLRPPSRLKIVALADKGAVFLSPLAVPNSATNLLLPFPSPSLSPVCIFS